jgi:photosystem II stability/assembly factor-like uncharacterized protein
MRLVLVLLTVGVVFALAAAEPEKPAQPKPPDASTWQDLVKSITDSICSRSVAGREENEVRLATVAVDRTNGWLYLQPGARGLWRSKDQGRSFQQIGATVINEGGARHAHSWASVQVHPEGGKIAVFTMCSGFVEPMGMCGFSLDDGATWKELVKYGRQFTMGTLNWDSDCQVILCTGWPDHGGLIYSSDGGVHWFQRNWGNARHRYEGVGIFSANVLVASIRAPNGGSATLRSENAGKSWTKIGDYETSGPVWSFKGKPYWMSRTGVLTTTNAGKSWTVVGSKLPVDGFAGPYFGKDEKHMVVATLRNGFYETADGGTTWHPLAPYPAVFPAEMTLLWHSFAYDPVHDVLYAHSDKPRDGKATQVLPLSTAKLELIRWPEAKIARPAAAAKPTAVAAPCYSGVWFTDARTGYVVGERGTILKTTNGGTSWGEQQKTGARDHLSAVHFSNADTGHVVGYLGTAFGTKDAGTRWASTPFGRKTATLHAIHFIDAQTGFATGEGCWSYKTTDGGASWRETARPLSDHIFYSIHFPGRDIGYVAGELGMIFKTSDGGTKWTRQTSGADSDLYSIWFVDAETGYAIGDRGTILKTTDSGAKWVSQTCPTNNCLSAVYFLDRNTGYAVGEAGTVLKTVDGGASWVKQTSGTEKHLYSVHFPDAKTGYAVGDCGTILKTKDGGPQWVLLKR